MALVTISGEPSTDFIVSSLLPIEFIMTETTANTVNVVAQVWYWKQGGPWTMWGGAIRCSNRYGAPTQYILDISDLVAGLPQGDIWDLQGLGIGDNCGGGTWSVLPETLWEYKSDWKVRIKVQREYKDTASGLIVLDPDVATSRQFYVHQGAASVQQANNGIRGIGDFSLMAYNHKQYNSGFHSGASGWLWLTDNSYQWRLKADPAFTIYHNEYRVNITKDEQFYLNFINGSLSGSNPANRMIIETYGGTGAPVFLNSHTHNYVTPPQNDGYLSIDVGFRTLISALTPNAAEGTDLVNVKYYYIYNNVSDTSGVATLMSTNWKFTVVDTCNGIGTRRGYRRFAWKNKLGAYDMFTSDGLLKQKKKTKQQLFQKRNKYMSMQDYGKTYYQTDEVDVYTVETQEMTLLDAQFFACMGSSTETYVRQDFLTNNGRLHGANLDVNGPSYTTENSRESIRDNSRCNNWLGIIILSKSVNVFKTDENTATVKFDYTFANNEILPRR